VLVHLDAIYVKFEGRYQWSKSSRWKKSSATSNKYVRLRGLTYIHTCRSYVHASRDFTNGASLAWRLRRRISTVHAGGRGPRAGRFVRFWASGGTKFTKIGDSLPWTPMNRRAKFDAAIALSSAEKSVTVQKHTNSNRYIHTLPISVCVGNESILVW